MVGEVRDHETAEIAIQVALTGHLVFSTLHTNDAASGVTRLLNMGIEPYLLTSTIECFLAQRLVRLICPKCKRKVHLSKKLIQELEIDSPGGDLSEICEGVGCEDCNFTGFKGRTSIYEFLLLNDKICELILDRASASEIKKEACLNGMKTLRQSGWDKVRQGLTTPEEVLRVTQERSKRK